ncbi:MAG: peptidase C39 [Lachnospiraceae bacterium]|nr:peptidase C39 [Lachnospiraceae bacterium]
MKNPLSYQSTEYDCGPTTVLNAINYLFPREEIYPDVVKSIMQYCLDCYSDKGEAYKNGTTGMAMMFLSNWLNHFGKVKHWPIQCVMVNGREVYIGQNSRIAECLQQGGAVVARVMLGCWHYVLLTGMDENQVYAFDPYYRRNPFKEQKINMVTDQPKRMNRKITWDIINAEGKNDYALGEIEQRECMLIYNQNTRQTMDNMEYVI